MLNHIDQNGLDRKFVQFRLVSERERGGPIEYLDAYKSKYKLIPWEWAVLDCLLAVLAPAVSILEVVDVALGHEGEPRLPRTLLILLPRFAIIIAPRRRRPRLPRRRLAPARTQYIIIISTNI